jgi:hypothetical protein
MITAGKGKQAGTPYGQDDACNARHAMRRVHPMRLLSQRVMTWGKVSRWTSLCCAAVVLPIMGSGNMGSATHAGHIIATALYPHDRRRLMTAADFQRYPGAGVLMCFSDFGTLERGAAAWLVGSRDLVVMNAHNFVNRHLERTRLVSSCFFRIGGQDRDFVPESLRLGVALGSKELHIVDDWALLRLRQPVSGPMKPQPVPDASSLPTESTPMRIVMVSPAGHSNSDLPTSLEDCEILKIDPPSADRMRRVRHDCNDGYGGSGSGLFTADGRLIAMHSASLDMNRRLPLDIDTHYGSAFLFEGELLDAIRQSVEPK